MKIAPKKKITDFEMPLEKRVEDILRNDPEHAYHATRLMVDHLGVKEDEIGGSFKTWKNQEAIALWRRIRNTLVALEEQGKIEKQREGKINYYWWNNHR